VRLFGEVSIIVRARIPSIGAPSTTRITTRRWIAFVLSLVLAGAPLAALADSSIQELVPKTVTPGAGSGLDFEIGVTSSDTTVWAAGSYTIALTATDPSGTTIAATDPTPITDAAAPGQTTFVFLTLPLPVGFVGPINVRAHLVHGNVTDDSVAVGIVVGGTALANGAVEAAPAAGQPPVPGATPVPGAMSIPGQPGALGQPPGQGAPGPPSSPAPTIAAATTAPVVAVATPAPVPSPPVTSPLLSTPTPTPLKVTGTVTNNDAFAAQGEQSGTLNLSGSFDHGDSFTANGGLATTPGAGKPLVTLQTQYVLTQVGTFSPNFDKDVFSGVSGNGIEMKRVWGTTHTLQLAYVSGDQATPNDYNVAGASYGFPIGHDPFEVTGGYEEVNGPAQTGQYFLRDGEFLGAGIVSGPPSGHSLTYELHYGQTEYLDEISGDDRSGSVIDVAFGFMLRKAQFSFGYVRAGPNYANLAAPGVKPDNEAETASLNVPLGVLQASLSANGYRDDLPGSVLEQDTHFWSESASLTLPFKGGDNLALQSSNGIEHQTGDPIAPFSGNDNTSLAYTTQRGKYQIQYTLTSTNQRDNTPSLVHVISDAINVSRAPFAGFTITAGYNLSRNLANVESGTALTSSANVSLTFVNGPFSFASQVSHSFSHPFTGDSPLATTTYNYGITLKPQHSPVSLSGTITENVGTMNVSTGNLNLNYQF
jgi:hypothetical protein